jgi:DNA replication protein DnaC
MKASNNRIFYRMKGTTEAMDTTRAEQLRMLGLKLLQQQWDHTLSEAMKKKPSYLRFLCDIIQREYEYKTENRRLKRLKDAKIPEMLVMETFPFQRQPRLKKKMVLQLYDSLDYMKQKRVLLLVGPIGCGKTGPATAYLVHAINQGARGRFIDFKDLLAQLYQSMADHSETKVLKRFAAIDCLLIDEVGYMPLDTNQAGLFFDIMKQRHRKNCTIITSQLGFEDWNTFINNDHIAAALIDRITENCTVFNMTRCLSIRQKNVMYATEKNMK